MRVTIGDEQELNVKPFPKLMISKMGTIVFFSKYDEGICIKRGKYLTTWDMSYFTDFTGSVTISND